MFRLQSKTYSMLFWILYLFIYFLNHIKKSWFEPMVHVKHRLQFLLLQKQPCVFSSFVPLKFQLQQHDGFERLRPNTWSGKCWNIFHLSCLLWMLLNYLSKQFSHVTLPALLLCNNKGWKNWSLLFLFCFVFLAQWGQMSRPTGLQTHNLDILLLC